jgi:hypothetical protein
MAFAALAAVTTLAFGWSLLRPGPPMAVTRVSVDFSEDQEVAGPGMFDISQDGSLIVYQGPGAEGGTLLWARRWDALEATPIQDTEDAFELAISPDGQDVAFETGNSIRVVPIQGGVPGPLLQTPPTAVCAGVPTVPGCTSVTWHRG